MVLLYLVIGCLILILEGQHPAEFITSLHHLEVSGNPEDADHLGSGVFN